jgi:RHS repeat-associated protein
MQSGVAGSAISLPKGGGALKGIGETFQSNLFSGAGNHTVPLALSPGRNGFGPSLSVQYSTGTGNGPFGLGWELSLPRIARKTEKGLPRYDDRDVFVMSGSEDLVPCLERILHPETGEPTWVARAPVVLATHTVFRYRPRTEREFARIERWVDNTTGDVHWRTTTGDNITSIYGATPAARIADPADARRVYEWLLEETRDSYGNHIVYEYARDNPLLYDASSISLGRSALCEVNRTATQLYVRRICYGNLADPLLDDNGQPITYADGAPVGALRAAHRYTFEVIFDYGDWDANAPHPAPPPLEQQELFGPDPAASAEHHPVPVRDDRFSSFRAGFEVRTLRLCRRVLMFHHFVELGRPTLVRSTDFTYRTDADTGVSLLVAATVRGYRRDESDVLASEAIPPVSFAYTAFRPHEQRYRPVTAVGNDMPAFALGDPNLALLDLYGDGLPGVLQTTQGVFRYWRNLGGGVLERPLPLPHMPAALALAQPGVSFGDVDGDGLADLLVHGGSMPGFYESGPHEPWRVFKPYASFPTFSLDDPNVRLVDLTGNGTSDALVTGPEHLLWFECLGERGFDAPQLIARRHDLDAFPDVFFDDPAGRTRLADMSGDGLQDIVVVHDGGVEYWPNLGYGRFGRRVTMDAAPRFGPDFDPARLFLADLNGTGCADLVYVDVDRVHFWFNRSGNGWSDRTTITGTPFAATAAGLRFADVFGTGTATLVWSDAFTAQPESHYKALDFCGGVKPYVLTEMTNNLGATTRVTYAPSTRYLLDDQANGRPWVSRLPFPVQVVDTVEVVDHISRTRHVTRYAYHHGYFDGREREFRGFGRVDQFDSERFEALIATGDDGNAFTNAAFAFHAPPVETRTWFHTGLYAEAASAGGPFDPFDYLELTQAFRDEFYAADADAVPLPEHDVEAGETPHEAYRALRGAVLRTEVYAHDGSSQAHHPYTVTENRYRVAQVQPGDANQRAVYFMRQLESLTSKYERRPADPRIEHVLALDADRFGNILRSLAIAYGRRRPDPDLSAQAQETQSRTLVTYVESRYTNDVDDPQRGVNGYRMPLPSETRTYELTGFLPAPSARQFSLTDWTANGFARLDAAAELAFEASPSPGQEQRRLVEHVRTRYRRDDLSDLLTLGVLEPLALTGETCQLAFTPALVTHVYGDRLTNDMLANDGGYVHDDGDTNWWVPSGRVFYSPSADDGPVEELSFARRHFFSPIRAVDPFGNAYLTGYDGYDLLTTRKRDPLGNLTTAAHDYRVLQPTRVTDPNGNRADVVFDALGLVVGTAVLGKATEAVGDTLTGLVPELTAQQRDAFLNDPAGAAASLLADATTRIVYDLHRFQTDRQPAFAAVISRETHVSDLPPQGASRLQIAVSYSDGFGRELQKKVQAEPGPLVEGGPVVSPRWIGTGWKIVDNKGQPVRKYEPFFDHGPGFRFAHEVGVTATLFYDPLGRVVATLHPNRTWDKVVFDAWHQEQWDANDTALIADPRTDADAGAFFARLPDAEYRPTWFEARQAGQLGPDEQNAADRTARHAATPSVSYGDPLGRTFLSMAHNRVERDGTLHDETYATRFVLDVEGVRRAVVDAAGRTVATYDYDMLGTEAHRASMESGEGWALLDAAGTPIYAWDSRGHRVQSQYDGLRRPTDVLVREGDAPARLITRMVYGEAMPDPAARNLRGKVVEVFDQAGLLRTDRYDFKGNLLESSRQLAREYHATLDWQSNPELEAETFTSGTAYDALNRPVMLTTPHTAAIPASVIRPGYNEGNLLERVDVFLRGAQTAVPVVSGVAYNAKGQRTEIAYTNGVVTRHAYRADDYRLARVDTTRQSDAATLQGLAYTYDPVGNVTHIGDAAQQTVYFANGVVTPDVDYVYDAVYRLAEAQGREHIGQASRPEPSWDDRLRVRLQHPHDGQAMRRYRERYVYDAAGNLQSMVHQAPGGDWTRAYRYTEPSQLDPTVSSNRLTSTSVGTAQETYSYDPHGNLLRMDHVQQLDWNAQDRLRRADLGGGGEAFYVYDAAGLRVRKVVERNGGALIEERIYIDAFEIFRRRTPGGSVTFARESLHVMDDKQRVALIETRTVEEGSPAIGPSIVRLQMGNHLGSATLELDAQGQVVSYEEHYPYGATSFQSLAGQNEAPKRYGYAGKERDEETGFTAHGARYYAPWLGRWTAADPAEFDRAMNAFAYCGGNPVARVDPDGADGHWINPANWCNPFSSDCDVVIDDIAVGAVKAAYQTGEDTVTRTIDLWSMYSPPAMLGHATGWYDLSTCLSPECKKYDPNKSLSSNIKGNVYDNTVGGVKQMAEGVANGDPDAAGALLFSVAVSRGKPGSTPKGGGTFSIKVPKLAWIPDPLSGTATATITLGEAAVCRPSIAGFGGPLLSSTINGGAYANSSPMAGGDGGSSSSSSTGSGSKQTGNKEPTRIKPPTITARPKGGPRSWWDESALIETGMTPRIAFPRSPLHHVIPKEMLKNPKVKQLLEKRGIDIDDFTVKLSEGEHSAIHTMKYNQKWARFFRNNPDAPSSMIRAFADRMRNWANIDPALPYERYK